MVQTIETFRRPDLELALHSWIPAQAEAVLFYVHGIQSHAGWLFETGPALAAQGIALYALDRRGSGKSGGPRGDTPSFMAWIEDYLGALMLVRERHPALPLSLLGQSMGGSIAAGVASDRRASYDALLFCAPALNQRRSRMSALEQQANRAAASGAETQLALKDEWYTRDSRFLSFMADDQLMVRAITTRMAAAILDLEDHYMTAPRPLTPAPSLLIVPRTDPIIDLPVAKQAFSDLVPNGITVEIPVHEHYLEFSDRRATYWQLVAAAAKTSAFD